MVGICGVLGAQDPDIGALAEALCYRGIERLSTYTGDGVSIGYVDHPVEFSEQPAIAETGDVLLWVWGTVLGHEHDGKYSNRPTELTAAEYCARLYDEHGTAFVAGLNSEFSGVIYDRDEGKLSLFTDRLGSRPIYYTWTDDGTLVFSSLPGSLDAHPEVELHVDRTYLSEFFTYSRALGTRTPIRDVRLVPPASLATVDTDGGTWDTQTYWWPDPRPRGAPFSRFVDRFEQVFTTAVRDRSDHRRETGVLLSGGTDSRAILAAFEGDVTGIHMNETREDREARIANRVTDVAGADFRFLRRGADYHLRILDHIPDLVTFNGLYHSAKAIGFADELTKSADGVFCGQYSDTLIGDTYTPTTQRSLLRFSNRRSASISSVERYSRVLDSGAMGGYNGKPPFVEGLLEPIEVVRSDVDSNGVVVSHGVSYPSWTSLVEFGMVYPITNARTFVNYETLTQLLPTHYPYLDNRIIDLILETPSKYRYGRDVVARTVSRLNPELASLPDPSTGIPVDAPYWLKQLVGNEYVNHLRETPLQELPSDFLKWTGVIEGDVSGSGTETHVSSGPWVDKEGIVRAHPFVEEKLEEHEERISAAPFLDGDAVRECYREHLAGESNEYELFALLTLLESPVVLAEDDTEPARDDTEPCDQ